MSFTSISFLIFLAIVVVINYSLPQRLRWMFLLAASYYFYINWQPVYAILLAATTAVTYLAARMMVRPGLSHSAKKTICWLGALLPLSALMIFKYYAFITQNVALLLESLHIKIQLPEMSLLLPVGISFYTFTAIGYLIDIYRSKYRPETNFGIFSLFIAFFAQITSGPIPRGDQLIPQLRHPDNLCYDNIMRGLRTILWGLFMKLCVADPLALYVNAVYGNLDAHYGSSILLAAVVYCLQIYCDFAGYSLIAIGAARMLGLHLMDNFRRPYLAKNLKEFWSRWHISLSLWLRDYVYIPLGGNRVSGLRHKFNILVTFLVCGLWHGASWNYVLWGGINGAGVIGQKAGSRLHGALYPFLQIALTFIFIATVRVFSRLSTIDHVFKGFRKIIFDFGAPFFNFVLLTGLSAMVLVVIKDLKDEYFPTIKIMNSDNFWISNISTGLLLALIVLLGSLNSNSFIYFQF